MTRRLQSTCIGKVHHQSAELNSSVKEKDTCIVKIKVIDKIDRPIKALLDLTSKAECQHKNTKDIIQPIVRVADLEGKKIKETTKAHLFITVHSRKVLKDLLTSTNVSANVAIERAT